jgi:hypothetical protein
MVEAFGAAHLLQLCVGGCPQLCAISARGSYYPRAQETGQASSKSVCSLRHFVNLLLRGRGRAGAGQRVRMEGKARAQPRWQVAQASPQYFNLVSKSAPCLLTCRSPCTRNKPSTGRGTWHSRPSACRSAAAAAVPGAECGGAGAAALRGYVCAPCGRPAANSGTAACLPDAWCLPVKQHASVNIPLTGQ